MDMIRVFILTTILCAPLNVSAQDSSFDELKTKLAIQTCVHVLDGYLCLSSEQHSALEKVLKDNWSAGREDSSRHIIWAGYGSGSPFADLKTAGQEKGLLTEAQLRQFDSLDKDALNQSAQLSYLQGKAQATEDPIKPTLTRACELEIQRLKKRLDLTDQQVRTLRLAAKGVTKRILEERQEWKKRLTNRRNTTAIHDWVRVAIEGPAFRIQKQDIWIKTLKRVLDDTQTRIYLDDQSKKLKLLDQIAAHGLTTGYFHEHKITLEEYQRVTKLIEDSLNQARSSGVINHRSAVDFEVSEVFQKLDDAVIKAVVTDPSWDVVKTVLDRLRPALDDPLNEPQDDQLD